eukprot:scaffold116354_cov65-Cyclotella_meneghiniana.AAC.3
MTELQAEAAGEVFRQQLLNDIASENQKYDIQRCNKLSAFMNGIELRFRELDPDDPDFDRGLTRSSVGSMGDIVEDLEGDGMWNVELCDFDPISLSGMGFGRLIIANQNVTIFKTLKVESVALSSNCFVWSLTLVGDNISISGEINGLSHDDCLHFSDGSYGERELFGFINSGEFLSSSNATYLPRSLNVCESSELLEYLQNNKNLLGSLDNSSDTDFDHDNVFRRTVIKAIGGSEDFVQLQNNNDIKRKINVLDKISDCVDEICLRCDGAYHTCSLSCGKLVHHFHDEENIRWFTRIQTTIKDIDSLNVSISGAALQRRDEIRLAFLDHDGLIEAQVDIFFYSNVIVHCYASVHDFDLNDDGQLMDDFLDDLNEGKVNLNVVGVMIELSAIEETLDVLGIKYDVSEPKCLCCMIDEL